MSTVIVSLLQTPQSHAVGDVERGKSLSATCAACHGTDGNSSSPVWPKIAGQHAEYLLKQLQDYKAGRRENAQMAAIVAGLEQQDMEDLAAWYASQISTGGQAGNKELALAGQRIYRAGDKSNGIPACMACHNPSGKGNPYANYPVLAGQHAEYTALQLKQFKQEIRYNDLNRVMRHIASRMSNSQMEAVAEYLQGLYTTE